MNFVFMSCRFLKNPMPGRPLGSTLVGRVMFVPLLVALHSRRGMSAVLLALMVVSLQASAVLLITIDWLNVGS